MLKLRILGIKIIITRTPSKTQTLISSLCVAGAVKVTPAHDHTDFDVGKRHNLETVQVIDERGLMTDACGEFAGLRRFDVRDVLPDRLASLGLLKGAADHPMIVPICR